MKRPRINTDPEIQPRRLVQIHQIIAVKPARGRSGAHGPLVAGVRIETSARDTDQEVSAAQPAECAHDRRRSLRAVALWPQIWSFQ